MPKLPRLISRPLYKSVRSIDVITNEVRPVPVAKVQQILETLVIRDQLSHHRLASITKRGDPSPSQTIPALYNSLHIHSCLLRVKGGVSPFPVASFVIALCASCRSTIAPSDITLLGYKLKAPVARTAIEQPSHKEACRNSSAPTKWRVRGRRPLPYPHASLGGGAAELR